ncbi:hypothetical protein BROUX41_000492 [Berkeleyomyces rouxiae]|uniref:uncharacterized protein n=1 Tax=Berkeleyomyces rouxiae TaxID=2035830 RepID=UPI003B7C75A9
MVSGAASWILRGLQAVIALTVLILAMIVSRFYNTQTDFSAPSQVNFLIFVPLFSFISLVYLVVIPKIAPRASHPFAAFVVEGLNALFYFSGFIALAVFISRLSFCVGSICTTARMAAVGGGIEFGLWTASTIAASRAAFGWTWKAQRLNSEPAPTPAMAQA